MPQDPQKLITIDVLVQGLPMLAKNVNLAIEKKINREKPKFATNAQIDRMLVGVFGPL